MKVVSGIIADTNSVPIQGVEVIVLDPENYLNQGNLQPGSDSDHTFSNSFGQYSFKLPYEYIMKFSENEVEIDYDTKKEIILRFNHKSYAPVERKVKLDKHFTYIMDVTLIPLEIGKINEKGEIVFKNSDLVITDYKDSVFDQDGNLFTDEFIIKTTFINSDDTNQLKAMPGDFRAVNLSGQNVHIESFNAFYIDV